MYTPMRSVKEVRLMPNSVAWTDKKSTCWKRWQRGPASRRRPEEQAARREALKTRPRAANRAPARTSVRAR